MILLAYYSSTSVSRACRVWDFRWESRLGNVKFQGEHDTLLYKYRVCFGATDASKSKEKRQNCVGSFYISNPLHLKEMENLFAWELDQPKEQLSCSVILCTISIQRKALRSFMRPASGRQEQNCSFRLWKAIWPKPEEWMNEWMIL